MSIRSIKLMFDKCNFGVVIKNDKEIWINEKVTTSFGYTQEDINEKGCIDFIIDKDDKKNLLKDDYVIKVHTKLDRLLFTQWEKMKFYDNDITFIHIRRINENILAQGYNEMRNSLNGIIGFTNIIMNNNNLDDDDEESFDRIIDCSSEINDTIKLMEKTGHSEKLTKKLKLLQKLENEKDNKNDISTKKFKIVYVEDNLTNAKLIESIMCGFFDTVEFHYSLTGKKGIELIRELKPDIILLDINIPDIGGYEIYNIVKAEGLIKDSHVIIISSEKNDNRHKDPLDPKSEFYFRKPIDGYKFCKFINKLIDGERDEIERNF